LLPQSPLARHISTGRHGKQQSNAEGEVMARSEAWRSYAAGSEVRHFAEFAKTHLIQSEDRWEGKPLLLEPWQKRMLGEALAYDERGWPIWRSVTAGRESLSEGALPPCGRSTLLRFGVAFASAQPFGARLKRSQVCRYSSSRLPYRTGFSWSGWSGRRRIN
jgi:hypothetical protein